ncbi:hypothetical protein [Sphingomonas melonis]
MNLLLLLSALLSALTGGASAVRAPVAAHAAAGIVASVQAEVRAARAASWPQQRVPGLAALADLGVTTVLALPTVEPLFASRRRE